MGRKAKDWTPVISEENEWLANDFMQYIAVSGIYEDFIKKFVNSSHWDEDIYQETILRVYNAILYNGCNSPVRVTKGTPDEERHEIWRNKFFIACKQNNTVGITSDKYRMRRSDNDVFHILKDEEYSTAERKVAIDLWNDFKVLKTLEYVEDNFSDIDSHLFKMYYMLPQMTYRQLQQISGMKDARTRVVAINRHLRENRELIESEIKKKFNNEYGNLEID